MNFIKEWRSPMFVHLELKIDKASVAKCCRGERLTAGGYKWEYIG